MTQNSTEKFWAKLDALGEEGVRAGITTNVYLGARRDLATAWLEKKVHLREIASSLEQARNARSANKAAWIAAIAVIVAAICAVVSLAPIFHK